jgi:hypothetical protein
MQMVNDFNVQVSRVPYCDTDVDDEEGSDQAETLVAVGSTFGMFRPLESCRD